MPGAKPTNHDHMSEHKKYWKNKFLNDLRGWGYDVPDDTPYDEVKAAHKEAKRLAELQGANTDTPDVPDANSEELSIEELKMAVQYLLAEREREKPANPQPFMTPEALKQLMLEVRAGDTDKRGMLRPGYVPPDDVIPTVKFWAPFHRLYIPDKPNGAVNEAVPLNIDMLRFEPQFGYMTRIGDLKGRKFVSALEINSRTIYKWLTGYDIDGKKVGDPHPGFGTMFFLNVTTALDNDEHTLWSQSYQKHLHSLGGKNLAQIMEIVSKRYAGVIPTNMTWGTEEYRSAVAREMTNEEFRVIEQKRNEAVRDRQAGSLLLKAEGVPLTA